MAVFVITDDFFRASRIKHGKLCHFRLNGSNPRKQAPGVDAFARTGSVKHRYLYIMLAGG